MTVAELITWLETQDQGAIVEVLTKVERRGWDCGDSVETTIFVPETTSEYTDFRDNRFAKGKDHENKRYLLLGCE